MTKKIILITGTTSGIGRDAALSLAGEGHRVIATGRRREALEALKRESTGHLDIVVLDVTDGDGIAAAVREVDVLTKGHGVDVLINNAGYGMPGALIDVDDDQLRAQFDTNVFGLMAVTRAFAARMLTRRSGRILNVSSIGGHMVVPFFGAYHASKYAVRALTDSLRNELKPFGIEVVLIEPGPIHTGFSEVAMDTFRSYRGTSSPFVDLYDRVGQLQHRLEASSAPVSVVSRAISRAVNARRPSVRYIAPFSSRLLVAAVAWAPDAVRDLFWSAVLRCGGIRPRVDSSAVLAA